jgi:aldose sugar dehydrogenase
MLVKVALLLVVAFLVGGFVYQKKATNISKSTTSFSSPELNTSDEDQMSVVAEGLDTPWAIAFLPGGDLLVTERAGRVRLVSGGKLDQKPLATLSQVKEIGEGGLLGIATHPKFSDNHYVYLYFTYSEDGGNSLNRVVRMVYRDGALSGEQIIVDKIPGNSNHNGGRIKFGPDNNLYISTGDAENPSQAQDTNSLGGKILRVTDEGKAVEGNPFNNLVYSYGHRNPQGLAWDSKGNLWSTEHGRSGVQSGLDELNLIESGKNYGWPTIQGVETKSGMETAAKNSGSTTWAPSGAAVIGDSIFFSGLRGQTLYQATIAGRDIGEVKEHFKDEFGRLREVIQGPDGSLYITTSNNDGRGIPKKGDDKIIRVNLGKL